MLRASRFPSSCEKVGKKNRTLANRSSPFQAWWSINSVRSLSTSKASTLLSADKAPQSQNSRADAAYISRVLRVTDFVSKPLTRLASTALVSAIFTSSRTPACLRLSKRRVRLLLVAAIHETAGPVRLASPWAECVEGALWRSLILVVLYREEVGSFQALRSRLRPTWYTKSSPSLLPRH